MSHRAPVALFVALGFLLFPALAEGGPAGAWINPIQPANRAAPIPGAVNGQLAPASLVTVEGACQLSPGAAVGLARLLADARAQGQALATDSCYRPLSGQLDAHGNACSSGNCACAATPTTSAGGAVVGTSAHGWGKAVDFTDAGAGLGFGSPGYAWLKANASRYGFNHPGWAEPGGSACPEAWHWEWVGDGGTSGTPPRTAGVVPTARGRGYWIADGYGRVLPFGDASYLGWMDAAGLGAPVVGEATSQSAHGYLIASADGGVYTFGDAAFAGSAAGTALAAAVVGIAASPTGHGYWLAAADGGIFNFGDATFYGSAA